ncbi:MAG: APC family permease [Clostridia bacterium]|nr:APC family permease [Clostridia bacterium]
MKDSYVFYKDKLQGEYKDVFDQVEMYVNCENIDELTREDRLGSLLDMLLSAQESGRPVKKVVGNSIEDFCKMFCSDLGTQNKIRRVLDTLKVIAIIELIFAFFDLLSADWSGTDFWSIASNVNASGYLFSFAVCILIGYITHFAVRSFMFKRKKVNMNLLKSIEVCMIVVSFIAAFVILSSDKLNFFTCPVWAVILVCAVYLVFYFIFNRKRNRENKQQKVNFYDVVSEQTHVNFDTIMEKRYNAFNKRNIKKGLGELSMREFLDNEEKDCDRSDKMDWLFYVTPVAITGLSLFCADFDSVFDMLFYNAIMLVVQYAIMHFFFKITKNTNAEKREWIAEKRNELDNE